jgi:hypothetical protein
MVIARAFTVGYLDNMSLHQSLTSAHVWIRAGQECLVPVVIMGISIWLPFVSGFLLKAARRLDLGFDWFNRTFDIERKPLQSIGLVAGALVAVVYWSVVIVSRVIG